MPSKQAGCKEKYNELYYTLKINLQLSKCSVVNFFAH